MALESTFVGSCSSSLVAVAGGQTIVQLAGVQAMTEQQAYPQKKNAVVDAPAMYRKCQSVKTCPRSS